MRPTPKRRQYIPYVNKTPSPKFCRSEKETVLRCIRVLQTHTLGPASGSSAHSSKLVIKGEMGNYNIINLGPGIKLARSGNEKGIHRRDMENVDDLSRTWANMGKRRRCGMENLEV